MQDQLADQVKEMQASINAARKASVLVALSKKRQAVLDSFGKVDPQRAYDAAIKLHQPGTGLWFTKGDDFKDWLKVECSRLWLYGIRKTPNSS
jgi:hypothetical protein